MAYEYKKADLDCKLCQYYPRSLGLFLLIYQLKQLLNSKKDITHSQETPLLEVPRDTSRIIDYSSMGQIVVFLLHI